MSFVVQLAWYLISALIFENSFFPLSHLKVWLLRLFGSKVSRCVYIKPNVKIKYPWKLTIKTGSSIGECVWIDNTEQVKIGAKTCVSQGVYICTGNHDYSTYELAYFGSGITIGDNCWLCAQSTILPGTIIEHGAVISAGTQVSGMVERDTIYTSKTVRSKKRRKIK